MKTILFSFFILFSSHVGAQSMSSIVENHVFVMCDEYGTPSDMGNGIHVYMVFHKNGSCNMLMGEDLSSAIDFGSMKSGKYSVSSSSVSFTWNDTGKGNTWRRRGNTDDLTTDGNIIKNLGGF